MTNGADGADARDGAPTRASRCRTPGANRRRPGAPGCSRPRGELDGPRDPRLREPVPAPVELGLGLYRHRLLPLGSTPRPGGAAGALCGPVGRRPPPAHPLRAECAVLPGAGVLADAALASRAPRSA